MPLSLAPGSRLLAATHNPGKARELLDLLGPGFDIVTAADLGLPEPEESETTFAGNALLKARAAADASGLIALADDSGLSVTALDGAPGIHSARWAGPERDFRLAMAKVEERLGAVGGEDASAWFTCALALAWPDAATVVVEARVDGAVRFPPRGDKGFGYDPIFVPDGDTRSFGEMDWGEHAARSHRSLAFAKLRAAVL
jgi:XTP/dITP diphosphohydrolase